jgi:hypothetical protein
MNRRTDRRAKRYDVRLQVSKLNGRTARETFVLDVSSLGARLETDAPLAPRNLAEFTVLLPGQDKETTFSGRVVWVRPLIQAAGRFQMGVHFISPQWDIDRLGREGKL